LANIGKKKKRFTNNIGKVANLAKSANNAKAPSVWQYGNQCRGGKRG